MFEEDEGVAAAADLRDLEGSCPWLEEDFRADLELLAGGTAAAARMYAADLRVIARLAVRVPRCAFDETGAPRLDAAAHPHQHRVDQPRRPDRRDAPAHQAPPGIDPDLTPGLDGRSPVLPDPDELAHLDQLQLSAPADHPPGHLRDDDGTDWTRLGDDDPPF